MRRDVGQGPEDMNKTKDLEDRKVRWNVTDQAEENRKETERIEEMKKKKQQG